MDYFSWKASYVRNASTPRVYKLWVDRFLTYIDKPVAEIKLQDVSEFRTMLRAKYAPKNVQFGMAILHDYLRFEMAQGLHFPIALFKVKKERANTHYTIKYWEYKKMLSLCEPHTEHGLRNLIMIRVLWETGVRVTELLRMQTEHVVKRGCQLTNEKNVYKRNVYWSQETDELLRFYLKLRRAAKIKSADLFISCGKGGCRGITARQMERIVRDISSKGRLSKKIVPHSFRHAFIHGKLLEGKSEPVVANMVGHSTTHTIMNYSKLSSRELSVAWGMTPSLSQIQVRGSVGRR